MCANSGALRAAYIMTWLSCAESLKRRFKAASPRDGAARAIVGDFERKESEEKSVDLFLLNKSKDYGFVTAADFLRLKHVYEKRCLFGHPYQTAPLDTEVIDAMNVVTACLLAKEIRMKHGYLEAQVAEITGSKTFLDDYQPRVAEYAQEIISRGAPDLLGWWLTKIWKKASPLISDPTMPWILRRVCWISDIVLPSLDEDAVKTAFLQSLTDEPVLASFCLARSCAFKHLPVLASDQVVSNLLDRGETSPSCLAPLFHQKQQGVLSSRQTERLKAFVEAAKVEILIQAKVPFVEFAERIVTQLKSYNWNIQNPTAEALLNVDDAQFALLTPALQEQLGRNLLQAGQNARECSKFITECGKGTKNIPSSMAYGMLAEMFFNDLGQLRPKLGCADGVLKVVGRLPEQTQTGVIDEVIAVLQRGQHKEVLCSRFEGVSSSIGFSLPQSQITVQNQQKLTAALAATETAASIEYQRIYGHPPVPGQV